VAYPVGRFTDVSSLEDVVRALFRGRTDIPQPRHVQRLGAGVFHLDHEDPDHVYLVTIREIPRVELPLDHPVVVGPVGGVPAQLVRVAIANHVELRLDAVPGPAQDAALREFTDRFEEWSRAGTHEPPPAWPAEEFARIRVSVSDDLGTPYRISSGQSGGTGTEWEVRWSFLPTPPPQATRLTLRFFPPAGTETVVALPLDDAQ